MCVAVADLVSGNYDVTRPLLAPHISLGAACPAIEKWGMRYVSCVAEWGNSELIRGNSYIIVPQPDTTHQYLRADDLQTQWKNAVQATDLSINIAQTEPELGFPMVSPQLWLLARSSSRSNPSSNICYMWGNWEAGTSRQCPRLLVWPVIKLTRLQWSIIKSWLARH